MERIKAVLLPAACALVGVAMISTAIYNREEFDIGGFVASLLFGLLFLGAGVLLFFLALPAFRETGENRGKGIRDTVLPSREGTADDDVADSLVTSFRNSFRTYFTSPGLPENSALQSSVTQLYWHVLYLKKRRMEHLGVSMDFDARRRTYGGKSLEKTSLFDPKYAVTEIRERIEAYRTYRSSGRRPFRRRSAELAHYTAAASRTEAGASGIICPNCGAVTTRENRLDGCDYCGTKFRIEDLGTRIASFVLRDDSQIAFDKYRDIRSRFELWITLLATVPVFLLSLIGMISVWDSLEAGLGMKIAAVILGAAFLAGIAWLTVYIAFQYLFDPILERIDSVAGYYTKKAVEGRKKREKQDEAIILRIQERDRCFSGESFFGGVQNKLAAIHFAESDPEAAVFASVDLRNAVSRYRSVVDADVVEMHLTGFTRDAAKESVRLETVCDLLFAGDRGFRTAREKLSLTMIRNPSAKTEAVCPPTVFLCRNCGRSLDLLNGGRCEYCGSSLSLFDRDWVIGEYRILS